LFHPFRRPELSGSWRLRQSNGPLGETKTLNLIYQGPYGPWWVELRLLLYSRTFGRTSAR
jgi:hypothetical protein